MKQFLDHLTNDALPALIERLSKECPSDLSPAPLLLKYMLHLNV
jgi:hypothetical protein